MLSLELVILDAMGCDLHKNPYALNETIRILIRTIVPFLILIMVALLTKPDETARLDRFYAKMKTPVLTDVKADANALALAWANPQALESKKLFPHSSWEFHKWTRTDMVGFLISCLAAVGVILLLMLVLGLGRT
jgi:SSS family solute:Na+ symporter